MVQFANVDESADSWGDRDVALYKAKIARQIQRKRDFLLLIRKVAILNPKLSEEERNMLIDAYTDEINERRHSREAMRERELQAGKEEVAAKDPYHQYHLHTINRYRERIDQELLVLCEGGIKFVKGRLMKHAIDQKSRIAYYKFCGDSARYAAEVTNKTRKVEFVEEAKESYKKAMALMDDENIISCDASRLQAVLNYSVSLKDLCGEIEAAIDYSGEAFRNAVQEMFLITTEEAYRESLVALGLLRDAVQMWCAESGKRNANEVFGIPPTDESPPYAAAETLESILSAYEARRSMELEELEGGVVFHETTPPITVVRAPV